jgi:hypothetical protein
MPTGTAARKAPRFRRTHLCGQPEDRRGHRLAANDPHSCLTNSVGRPIRYTLKSGGSPCDPSVRGLSRLRVARAGVGIRAGRDASGQVHRAIVLQKFALPFIRPGSSTCLTAQPAHIVAHWSSLLRLVAAQPQSLLNNPIKSKIITAPMTALMISATIPPTRTNPTRGKSRPA